MATIFTTAKPKKFEHRSSFTNNERKAFLEARVRKVKREMGLLPDEEWRAEESIRGTFVQGTTHLKRRQEQQLDEGETPQSALTKRYIKLAISILLLCIIFYYLIK